MAGMSPEETDRLITEALERQDVDGVVELFESDGVFIDPDSGTEIRGHDAIREALLGLFESEAEGPRDAPTGLHCRRHRAGAIWLGDGGHRTR